MTESIEAASGSPLNGQANSTSVQSNQQGAANSEARVTAGLEAVKSFQAGLGESVGLLMRDPTYRHLALADLEWLLLPAVAANQVMTMRAKVKRESGAESGLTVPVALALYAKVSIEVDEKLTAQKAAGAPLRLSPSDWTSGDIPWLVLASGQKDVIPGLHAKMKETLGMGMKVF